MKKIFYLILGCSFALLAASCGEDEGAASDNEEYVAGNATLLLTVVDDATKQPIPGVTVKHVPMKIAETTSADGSVTLHLTGAPRALVGLEFTHEIYDTYTTAIAIGEVQEGKTKEVRLTVTMNMKAINYVAALNVIDDSTFLPVQGVAILGLLTGSDGTNEEGSVNIRFPGPGSYALRLAHPEYDTLDFRVQIPDAGIVPGETVRVDLGTKAMTLFGGFRIVPVNLAGNYTVQVLEESRGRGSIGGTMLSRSQFMDLAPTDFTWEWDRRADFAGVDFDYTVAASGTSWCYPLCFKVYYEESPHAPGCYRVELTAFLEPFSETGNHTFEDRSYYDYKNKQLVLHFEMYESWNGTRGWDHYVFTLQE
ncbi:MAG: hypothetical protein LBP56_03060 [Odoribacteraceae bacterium]|jgi:hypothetical protein|nr:hypothetical protein [Odoribacteraceae bacterium]